MNEKPIFGFLTLFLFQVILEPILKAKMKSKVFVNPFREAGVSENQLGVAGLSFNFGVDLLIVVH